MSPWGNERAYMSIGFTDFGPSTRGSANPIALRSVDGSRGDLTRRMHPFCRKYMHQHPGYAERRQADA